LVVVSRRATNVDDSEMGLRFRKSLRFKQKLLRSPSANFA
jgi:hypothetical protein